MIFIRKWFIIVNKGAILHIFYPCRIASKLVICMCISVEINFRTMYLYNIAWVLKENLGKGNHTAYRSFQNNLCGGRKEDS